MTAAPLEVPDALTIRSGRFRFRLSAPSLTPAEQKAIITIPTDPSIAPRVSSGGTPPVGVRSLIPQATTTQAGVWYLRETSFTNRAGVVPPGTPKPQSDATYEGHTSTVTTVAHFAKLSRQLADDYPAFMAQLETRLLYFILLAEDDQIINGTGAGGQTDGILPLCPGVGAGPVPPAQLRDAVAEGAGEVADAGFIPSGVVLNAGDYWRIPRPETGTLDLSAAWGVPIVPTTKIAAGQFIVGDFIRGAQIFDREAGGVEVADENVDDFVRDVLTVRAESRFAQCVYQPGAFRKAG